MTRGRLGALVAVALVAVALVAACTGAARLPFMAGVGPDPQLPAPTQETVPTVNVAEARGWPQGTLPKPTQGLRVVAFAAGLDHPRWLHVLPNGDVLVAETNRPPKPEELQKGLKNRAMAYFMKKAGAGGQSANRITLLRDKDGDGVAEHREMFLDKLMSPFGMALVGHELFIANADGIVKVAYDAATGKAVGTPVPVTALPGGPRNHHWTKALIASPDGSKLYATVGSNSNVAENGMAEEEGRAAIWEVDVKTGAKRLFASGLRNPNGMGWEPASGVLWTVVNERDELGSDLVPDYLTSVRDGGFYGWPYSYYGQHVDARVEPPRPDLVAKAIRPEYALGTHVAPLGLAFADGARLGAPFTSGAFIGQHGSWNRRPKAGYNVVFVPFTGGKPSGPPVEVLGGFLDADEKAYGRPVGVAIDRRGGLLVADDVGNIVWRVAR